MDIKIGTGEFGNSWVCYMPTRLRDTTDIRVLENGLSYSIYGTMLPVDVKGRKDHEIGIKLAALSVDVKVRKDHEIGIKLAALLKTCGAIELEKFVYGIIFKYIEPDKIMELLNNFEHNIRHDERKVTKAGIRSALGL